MPKAFLEFNPPAFALELRHRVINKARPVLSPLWKPEGNSTGVAGTGFECLEGVQSENLQAFARRALGDPVAAAHDDATVLEAALLIPRAVWIDHRAAVAEAQQCQIDALIPAIRPHPAIARAPLATSPR